jgi:molybdate transport system permease protein
MVPLVLFTIETAAVSTLLILPIALALATAVRGMPARLRAAVEAFSTLPLVLPPTAVGLLLVDVFSRRGPLGPIWNRSGVQLLFTWPGVVIASATMAFPLMFRSFRVAIEGADIRLFDIARTLGASRARAFFRVTLPLAWRGLVSGVLLAFCRALGEFGATVLVGGNIPGKTQTISLAIYQFVQSGEEERARPLLLFTVAVAIIATATSEWITREQRGDG